MEETSFYIICSMVILFVSAVTSITTLFTLVKNSSKKIKDKHATETKTMIMEILKESLPEMLHEHDLEVRDRYKADRDRYLHEIQKEVLSSTREELNQIKILGIQYEALAISAKDVLREKIIAIYTEYRDERKLPVIKREKLDQFYKDYKDLKGNSYIDKYYSRMSKWTVVDDDYGDDENII